MCNYNVIKPQYRVDIPEGRVSDAYYIKQALYEHGIRVSAYEAWFAWDKYSDSMAAGWMMIPETDEEIVAILTMTVKEEYDYW